MSMINFRKMQSKIYYGAAAAAAAIFIFIPPITARAGDKIVIADTLLDRIIIEDMLVKYYVDLTSGSGHDLARYYTEDAVLDVNGTITKGREAIKALYDGFDGGEDANLGNRVHMLLNNPIINIDGDKATAWLIWTGVINDDIKKPPRFLEQGREYDVLVKIEGRWYIKERYITADSGLPDIWKDTYKPRRFR